MEKSMPERCIEILSAAEKLAAAERQKRKRKPKRRATAKRRAGSARRPKAAVRAAKAVGPARRLPENLAWASERKVAALAKRYRVSKATVANTILSSPNTTPSHIEALLKAKAPARPKKKAARKRVAKRSVAKRVNAPRSTVKSPRAAAKRAKRRPKTRA